MRQFFCYWNNLNAGTMNATTFILLTVSMLFPTYNKPAAYTPAVGCL